ncbi:MAG: cystathionine gamma-synthase [Rhodothermales bacterium]|nr:cystathionine gamma-synthase [Rhodothermales bacterium]
MGFGTLAVHAGQQPDPSSGAIMTPIYQTSTYVQSRPGVHQGHDYARVSNPTRSALQGNLAALENAKHGVCFSSGVASIDAIIKNYRPGDKIISTNDLYGGTFRLFTQVFEPFGLKFSFIDLSDLSQLEKELTPDVKMIWLETPTNPLLRIIDIKAISDMVSGSEIDVIVDNTFATPYLQRPLDLGANMVMHSTTKYIGGHSDVIGGAICTNSDEWEEKLMFQIKSTGAAPGPMDSWLLLRGTKTLHIRMQRHCENARAIVSFLSDHPKVDRVLYPGLPDHPGHEIAARQMKDFGGMITFTLKNDSLATAENLVSSTNVFALAESLGGVESLIEHPASMTHASIPEEERMKTGLNNSLIRLSVGIEDIEDLVADLDQALAGA